MAKVTAKYETLLVFSAKKTEEEINALVEKFTGIITDGQGTVENVDTWGKRRLAYEINKEADGYYVIITFTSVPSLPAELERVLKITDGILRFLTTIKQ